MAGDGQAVTITELRPPGRILTLAGRDLPETPVTVSDQQRAVQTRYPGTRVASVQVLGDDQEPITLRGRFADPLNAIDGGTLARVQLLHGLRQSGSLCRLVWGDRIRRVGRIARVDIEWYQEDRARYEIRFDVDANEEIARQTPLKPRNAVLADLRDGVRAVQERAEELADAARAAKLIVGVVR